MKKTWIILVATLAAATASQAVSLATNTNNGFGGVLGNSSTLDFTDDGTTLTITWATGGGAHNDIAVFYFDTTAGGATDTTSLTDSGDPGRSAISGFDGTNTADLTFGGGFGADSALSIQSGFAGFFNGLGASHNFVTSANLTGSGTGGDPYVMDLSLANLGVTPGDSFNVVATYISGTAFRSDEALASAGLGAGNPGNASATFTGFDTVTTVPEPSSAALLGLGGLALVLRRRK